MSRAYHDIISSSTCGIFQHWCDCAAGNKLRYGADKVSTRKAVVLAKQAPARAPQLFDLAALGIACVVKLIQFCEMLVNNSKLPCRRLHRPMHWTRRLGDRAFRGRRRPIATWPGLQHDMLARARQGCPERALELWKWRDEVKGKGHSHQEWAEPMQWRARA